MSETPKIIIEKANHVKLLRSAYGFALELEEDLTKLEDVKFAHQVRKIRKSLWFRIEKSYVDM